ncbi:MAG: hypothetical protein LUG65_06825 [Clostridiales bacterium]|nr:hypothetical protein [Clostridiales bacterium]
MTKRNRERPKNSGGGTHSALLALVGAYILYMAWQMLQNAKNGTTSMSMTQTLVLAGVMALAAVGVFGYAAYLFYTSWKAFEWEKLGNPDEEEVAPAEEEDFLDEGDTDDAPDADDEESQEAKEV